MVEAYELFPFIPLIVFSFLCVGCCGCCCVCGILLTAVYAISKLKKKYTSRQRHHSPSTSTQQPIQNSNTPARPSSGDSSQLSTHHQSNQPTFPQPTFPQPTFPQPTFPQPVYSEPEKVSEAKLPQATLHQGDAPPGYEEAITMKTLEIKSSD